MKPKSEFPITMPSDEGDQRALNRQERRRHSPTRARHSERQPPRNAPTRQATRHRRE
jgi:hypothetical protein